MRTNNKCFMENYGKRSLNYHQIPILLNGPPHDKTNIMTFAPSEDSDQPRHPPSLSPHEETLSPQLFSERTAKTLIRLGGNTGLSA